MTKRFCFVTNEIYPGTVGGIGRLLSQAVGKLASDGFEVICLLVTPFEAKKVFAEYARCNFPTVRVCHVSELGENGTEVVPDRAFRYENYALSYKIARALAVLHSENRLDGVEFTDYLGLAYVTVKEKLLTGGIFSTLPVWVRLHCSLEIAFERDHYKEISLEYLQLYHMERYALRHADGWISPSEDIARFYREYYGISEKHMIVSPPEFQQLGPGNEHTRKTRRPFKILFYGKCQPIKGLDILVEAAVAVMERAVLENGVPIEVDIVGQDVRYPWTDSYLSTVLALIPENLRERFNVHGRIKPEELRDLALDASVAVVPSRVETFCLAAHEVNWIGCPLVLPRIEGFTNYFEDGVNCRFFDGTVDGLVAVLTEILSNESALSHLFWNGREICDKIDTLSVYRRAIEDSPGSMASEVELADEPVSVLVFCKHGRIGETLRSVDGVYENLEVLLCDDGIRDAQVRKEYEALRQFRESDPRFTFVSLGDRKMGKAFNTAISKATGRFVLPLVSGDAVHPDFITTALGVLVRNPVLMGVNAYVEFFKKRPGEKGSDFLTGYGLDEELIGIENKAGPYCTMFRMDLFDCLEFDESLDLLVDWEFWWQAAKNRIGIETIPRVLLHCREHKKNDARQLFYAFYDMLRKHEKTPGADGKYFRVVQAHQAFLNHQEPGVVRSGSPLYPYEMLTAHCNEVSRFQRFVGRIYRGLRRVFSGLRKIV